MYEKSQTLRGNQEKKYVKAQKTEGKDKIGLIYPINLQTYNSVEMESVGDGQNH